MFSLKTKVPYALMHLCTKNIVKIELKLCHVNLQHFHSDILIYFENILDHYILGRIK